MTNVIPLWPPEMLSPAPADFQGISLARCRTLDDAIWLPEGMPLVWAKTFAADRLVTRSGSNLIFWHDEWREWTSPAWDVVPNEEIRRRVYDWLSTAMLQKQPTRRGGEVEHHPFPASRRTVDDLLDALRGLILVPSTIEPFQWRCSAEVDARFLLPCVDGLVDLETGDLLAGTRHFMATATPSWRWSEEEPEHWYAFLQSVFRDDPDQGELLQEAMGLLLSGFTDFQGIFALIGPPRSGKGTVVRVLQHALGPALSTAMTTTSLTGSFGLAGIIGRRLAVVPDMRVDPRVDGAALLERLLQISGGDHASIARKYVGDWQGLPTARLAFAANELPRLRDDSGALAKRLVPVVFRKSFVGSEDPQLTTRLLRETAGIVRWAAAGLETLLERQRFALPDASRRIVSAAVEGGSPITNFVSERCIVAADGEVDCDDLWNAWRQWCEMNGERPGTSSSMGRALRSAFSQIDRLQKPGRRDEPRPRFYRGIALSSR